MGRAKDHRGLGLGLGGLATLVTLAVVPPLAAQDCSVPGQNEFVADVLDEFYYWYRELPPADPSQFDSPEAYLDAVRFRPLDESFSFIAHQAESDAFFSESLFVGIGFGSRFVGTALRIAQVFPDSPASEAGLVRGDTIVAIDGVSVDELLETGQFSGAFGPGEIGYTVELIWRSLAGDEHSATVVKRAVTIPTVSHTAIFDIEGRLYGYIHFRNFVRPSTDALNNAFAAMRISGVDELVLDLRYNGGGLVDVAQHLGSLIGGTGTFTRPFVEFFHNDKNTARNLTLPFENPLWAMDLERLVVITSRASASASELVINGLRPFVPVTVVGDSTFGKPVGQYGFDFCDKTLFPVAFQLRNALGEGDYFGGLPADCAAVDDLDHPLGASEEASLAEALHFLRTGSCSDAAEAAVALSQSRRASPVAARPTGWQQLVNAH